MPTKHHQNSEWRNLFGSSPLFGPRVFARSVRPFFLVAALPAASSPLKTGALSAAAKLALGAATATAAGLLPPDHLAAAGVEVAQVVQRPAIAIAEREGEVPDVSHTARWTTGSDTELTFCRSSWPSSCPWRRNCTSCPAVAREVNRTRQPTAAAIVITTTTRVPRRSSPGPDA